MTTFVLGRKRCTEVGRPLSNQPLAVESLRLFKRYRDGELDFVVPDTSGRSWATFCGEEHVAGAGVAQTRKTLLTILQIASSRRFPLKRYSQKL